MPRLNVRRANRRRDLYTGRLAQANTEKSMLNAVVGWLMGEYHAAAPERRRQLRTRLKRVAEEMNEEARR